MLECRTNKKGITLVALIVTIVILLILSTVTVMEVRETALFDRSKTAVRDYKEAQIDEQNKMDKWANDIDTWANDKPEELKIGDYVEYDVTYKDMCTDEQFTKENGWRVLEPGTINSEGKYDNVKIISTGVPAMLRYYAGEILDATGEKDSYAWKPTAEELAKYKKKVPYYNKGNDNGVTAAAGLYYHADKIQILQSDPGEDEGKKNGKGWLSEIYKKENKITEEESLGEIILIPGIGEKIEYPTLEIVKGTLKPREGRNFQENTDKDVIGDPNDKFTKEEDAAKGFWNLKELGFNGYESGKGNSGYWIASTHSDISTYLRRMGCTDADGYFYGDYNTYFGLRPIVSLKSGIEVHKSDFQGN